MSCIEVRLTFSKAAALEAFTLDGRDDWPLSATRKKWFRITRELVASTIAEMDLEDEALSGDDPASIQAGLL